jgi:hypothetical protein
MARARTPQKRKKVSRKNQQSRFSGINGKKLLYTFFLLTFLCFSVGILTYVVFFRVVVAAELDSAGSRSVLFEEPDRPIVIPHNGVRQEQVSQPKYAIIVDDMGYHREIGKQLIHLPLNLSFSFLPHAPHTSELESLAYRQGKTVLLHLPLQPRDSVWDPGPGALYVNENQHQKRLFLENLHLVPHAIGVNNHMGSLYTEKRDVMESLLDLIEMNSLFFVDSYTSPESLGFDLARRRGLKSARRQIFLDNDEDVEAICDRLNELVQVSLRQGQAIGIAHPYKETLTALQSCMDTAQFAANLVGVDELVH